MKRLHVLVMLMIACFWVFSGSVQAKTFDIGNLVWNDLNKNGIQDPGEPGIPNVDVYLYALPGVTNVSTSSLADYLKLWVAKTTTDIHGNYSFGNLPAGPYVVKVDVPEGWAVSPMFQGTSDENDSDIFPYFCYSGLIWLTETGQTPNYRLSLDAGLFEIKESELITIGDMVFNDCNRNGVQDCDEKGIAGVVVKLYACNILPDFDIPVEMKNLIDRYFECGFPVAETVTDLNGHYEFGKILPGEYCIKVCLPEGYSLVPRPGCPDICSPMPPKNDHTGCTMFNACTKNLDIDFAVCSPSCDLDALGDLVWLDPNKDGIQNMGETGFSGVKVTLYKYCYCCGEPAPDGAVNATDVKTCVPWKVGSVTTDANGKYLFPNLLPGYYRIVVTPPFGYSASPWDQNVDTRPPDEQELTYDSDINPANFTSKWIHITGVNKNIDAGLYEDCRLYAAINGHVWVDGDEDGVRDDLSGLLTREPGLAGVTLKLYKCVDVNCANPDECGGALVATTKSDKDGYYEFTKLDPKTKYGYCVKIDLPSCYKLTKQVPVPVDVQTGTALVTLTDYYSDFNPKTKHTVCLLPIAGCDKYTTVDAGLYYSIPAPGTIGDLVWEDANKNGIQDCDEKGICGVTVELHKASNGATVATTKTDENGRYVFTNVPGEESYYVKFVLPGQYQFTAQDAGEDDVFDSDACPEKGITASFTLGDGQSTIIIDAGMYPAKVTVSDIVWVDTNLNGIMEESEGIGGVNVELYNCDGDAMVQSVTTATDGRYTFSNITGGSYYLKITIPAGYVLGTIGDSGVNADFVVSQSPCFVATTGGAGLKIKLLSGVEGRTGVPTEFAMDQNFPNPFNPSTTIQFAVPQAGQFTLKVYNMLGQEVATLLNGELNTGYHTVVFDASKLTSGVYIYRLTGTNVVITKKMMLNK